MCSVRHSVRAQGSAQHHGVRRQHNEGRRGRYVVHIFAAARHHVSQRHHATARNRAQPLRAVRLARRVSQDRRLHGARLRKYA